VPWWLFSRRIGVEKKKILFAWSIAVVLGLTIFLSGSINDDFEVGVIDTSKWVVDGQKRGYAGSPAGSWQWSNTEETASDGYFKGRVWGPYTGNTYGAETWIRTTTNFHDGGNYVINFKWQPDFADAHYNIYFVQITDGYIPSGVPFHWQLDGEPGTTDLLWRQDQPSGVWRQGLGFENQPTPGILNWSIEILASGIARLYNAPNKGGTLMREESLDLTKDWYFRLMVNDGTSAGFGAGDAWFNVYDFSVVPEPATILLLTLGGLVLRRKR
jgi:hypothetical protein